MAPPADRNTGTIDPPIFASCELRSMANTVTLLPIVDAKSVSAVLPVADFTYSSAGLDHIDREPTVVSLNSARALDSEAKKKPSVSTVEKGVLPILAKRNGMGVDGFPPELIGEIMTWYCSSPARLPARETSSDVFTFGRVCSMWRGVASFRKDVWSSLHFEWAQCTPMLVAQEAAALIAHIFQLSGNHPLTLQLSISAPREDVNSNTLRVILAPIFSQRSRWQHSLRCSSEILEAIILVDNIFDIQLPTPLLESFIVQSKSKLPRTGVEVEWPRSPSRRRNAASAPGDSPMGPAL